MKGQDNYTIGRGSGKSTFSCKQAIYKTIEQKKREVWEENHPNEKLGNRVIILLDQNPKHITNNNLEAVTRAELVVINRMKGFSKIPGLTKLVLTIARLKIARAKAIKNTPIEIEDKYAAQRKYQSTEKGRLSQNKSSRTYWAKHSADPEWRAEYNRKQRERRHNAKRN